MEWQARRGEAWTWKDRRGEAGRARQGTARRGGASHRWLSAARRGTARRGIASLADIAENITGDATMSICEELEEIKRQSDDGTLKPEAVVAYAEDPATELHSRFEWDQDKAAHQHRLWQAREIIRVHVTILPQDDRPVRAYVSLPSDRSKPGGGYRGIVDVLENRDWRAELLAMALDELGRWQVKYKHLSELSVIFAEAEKLRAAQAARDKRRDSRRPKDQPVAP
jgi:hypothetical protein